MSIRRRLLPLALLPLLGACAAAPPPPAPPPPAPPPPPPLPTVWTRTAGVVFWDDTLAVRLPRPAMRLEPLPTPLPVADTAVVDTAGADTAAADTAPPPVPEVIRARCAACDRLREGWVRTEDLLPAPPSPAAAAEGELAAFVAAVREAAVRRDVAALRGAMSREFIHSFAVRGGILETIAAWEREGFRTLDRLPALLDGGVEPVPGTGVWAAPEGYARTEGWPGLRTGFRRRDGRWEWAFLVQPAPPAPEPPPSAEEPADPADHPDEPHDEGPGAGAPGP